MSAHTPGPWTHEVHELSSGYSAIVYDANGYRLGGFDHLTEADARLIAAAPEMLDALKRAVIEMEMWCPVHAAAEIKIAKAAIAKAETTNV